MTTSRKIVAVTIAGFIVLAVSAVIFLMLIGVRRDYVEYSPSKLMMREMSVRCWPFLNFPISSPREISRWRPDVLKKLFEIGLIAETPGAENRWYGQIGTPVSGSRVDAKKLFREMEEIAIDSRELSDEKFLSNFANAIRLTQEREWSVGFKKADNLLE